MIYYLITAVFILTIAIASGSIVISTQLRTAYKSDFFSTLLFFLSFYFTFGFYAIWGQLIATSFLTPFVAEEFIPKILDIMVLLGSPFLIFASLMFVRFTREVSGRKTSNSFVLWYIFVNLVLIVGLGYAAFKFQHINVITFIRYYFIVLSFLYTSFGAYFFLFPQAKQTRFRPADLNSLSFGLLVLMLFQNVILLLSDHSIFIALLFIMSYFTYGGFVTIYIKYKADLSGLISITTPYLSFDHFYTRYGISRRETEIIVEICNGLTNQQIADKLFISLQTVKDHTHRIYSKTDCSSRAQLIKLVNQSSQSESHK